jgi:hypothetical protein
MPDALPMEITLIALFLFKLQVYSTSLHDYYHRPITLSMFQLFHQSTLHHMVSINTLQLPIKKFFVHKIGALHTQSTASHCYDFFLFYFTFYTSFSFSNLAYIITLIPGHESLIYDSHYLSLTHVPRFDSFCTIIRYDSSVALTHTYSI